MNATAECDLTYTEHPQWKRGEPLVHRILVITYFEGTPSNVVTDHGDFEFCNIDGTLYFHNSGSGLRKEHPSYHIGRFVEPEPPPCKIWAADGVSICQWKSQKHPDVPVAAGELRGLGYVRLRTPLLLKRWEKTTRNPFEVSLEHEGHFEYCSICKADVLDDDLCEHLYQPNCGEIVGAGGEEPSQESFFAALDWLEAVEGWRDWQIWPYRLSLSEANPLLVVEHLLLSKTFRRMSVAPHCLEAHFAAHFDGELDDWQIQFDECENGLGWLTTLGQDTPEANAKTLRWIMEWRLSKAERAKAKERKQLIKELQALVTDANRPAIIQALGIRGKAGKELEKVPTERIRDVVESVR